MPLIYVSDPIHDDVLAGLHELGDVRLGYGPGAVDYAGVGADVDAVMLRTETFTREMIAASPRLRIIARHGVGTDNVDLAAAADHGVLVTVTPGRNSRAVAEHVFALTLALARKVSEAGARTRSGIWSEDKVQLTGLELHGRTMGLLGFGSTGSLVAGIARGFGMDLLVTTRSGDPAPVAALGGRVVGLDELLAGSDVLSLHVPLTPDTDRIIDGRAIGLMRPGALLINTSRGGLVDETALVAALRAGRIGGAGLDVIDAESTDMKWPLKHNRMPLDELDTLIVTPHVAGQTQESLREVGRAALGHIRQALAGETPDDLVPLPGR